MVSLGSTKYEISFFIVSDMHFRRALLMVVLNFFRYSTSSRYNSGGLLN